jgi:hypothetical protein
VPAEPHVSNYDDMGAACGEHPQAWECHPLVPAHTKAAGQYACWERHSGPLQMCPAARGAGLTPGAVAAAPPGQKDALHVLADIICREARTTPVDNGQISPVVDNASSPFLKEHDLILAVRVETCTTTAAEKPFAPSQFAPAYSRRIDTVDQARYELYSLPLDAKCLLTVFNLLTGVLDDAVPYETPHTIRRTDLTGQVDPNNANSACGVDTGATLVYFKTKLELTMGDAYEGRAGYCITSDGLVRVAGQPFQTAHTQGLAFAPTECSAVPGYAADTANMGDNQVFHGGE